jgi:WD40-like Beta Propeller Repeat
MQLRRYTLIILFLSAIVVFMLITTLHASDNQIERVSVSSMDVQANNNSFSPAISFDERFVVFTSDANNLVVDDNNNVSDVFRHDRETGNTERVSISNDGDQGNLHSYSNNHSVSGDGSRVVFSSSANNLVEGDTNGNIYDIFVRDLYIGRTIRLSVSNDDQQANAGSTGASISANGRYVVFLSIASNLVTEDANGNASDVFVRDLQTNEINLVSISSTYEQANGGSNSAQISDNGQYVAFSSVATNLVDDDTNGTVDIFVRDLQANETWRVSVSSNGTQGDLGSFGPVISGDGRFVAFTSPATNLVANDTNNLNDAFLHDIQTGETLRTSVSSSGVQSNGITNPSSLNYDGGYVVMGSDATNLVANDTNGISDVFIYERYTGETMRVSVSDLETEGNGNSNQGAISDSGYFIAWQSYANNLVETDSNNYSDIFVSFNPLVVAAVPPTNTPQYSSTPTNTPTATNTLTPSHTPTATNTPTSTYTLTPSNTPTATSTAITLPNDAPVHNYYLSLPFKLTWNPLTWAVEYEIQVDNSSSFTLPLNYSSTLPNPVLEASITTLADGTYYWRVRAKDNNGNWQSWSKIQQFTLSTP